VIGVTGTNGKSTVTALINHILGEKSQMGGNIGVPVMALKNRVDYTVLELSSYQLEYAPHLKCDVAVLLNITPDHLDWHGDMDHYISAKSKIFDGADVKIISIDDENSKSIFENCNDAQSLSIYDENMPFNQSDFPRLKGDHNLQNILAAYKVCVENDLSDVQHAYLFGQCADEFNVFLKSKGIETSVFETLDDALIDAHKHAQSMRGEPSGSPTVLFSPACASFDQYPNFEIRGDHFVDLVNELEEE